MNTGQARKTVLVVDDEPQVLAAIEDTLEGDYRVLANTSPRAAIRLLAEEPELSVILSDQRMPEMNGDEFLTRASAMSGASRLMITGYAELEAVIRAVNNGRIFGYVSKPWDPAALKLTIAKAAEHHRLLRELSAEKRLFANLMDNIPDAIFFKDSEHRFLRLNQPHAARIGVARPEDAVGRATRVFFADDEAKEREAEDDEIMRTGAPITDKVRQTITPQGGLRWSSTTKAPLRDEKGKVTGLVGISRDITRRRVAEEGVRRLNRVYAVLSAINALTVRVRNRDELFREACRIAVEVGKFHMAWIGAYNENSRTVTPVGCAGHEAGFLRLAGLQMDEPVTPGRGAVRRAVREKKAVILNHIQEDEFPLREEALARGYRSGAVLPLIAAGTATGVFGLFSAESRFFDAEEIRLLTDLAGDIAFAVEHIEKSERLDYLAFYDALTGLANRTLFLTQVDQACDALKHSHRRLAVVVIDIERFKTINDSLGRNAGDALLKEVADRMQAHAAESTRFARIGADHFAVLVPEIGNDDDVARRVDQRLRQIFGPPYHINESELRIAAKVGIAVYPTDGTDADSLHRNAETAVKKAKQTGERYLFYSQKMSDRVADRLNLETRLQSALEREEFLLHYQPKVDLANRRIVGLEALIRWRTAEGELVPPGRFIPLMEETGLIVDVGTWALGRAAGDYRALQQQGIMAPPIAVNVSAMQLRKRDFVDRVQAAIGTDAGIDLEITESLIMDGMEENIAKLNAMREFGSHIAIDDFGTGYSSLAYLAKLPVHALKIDRAFIMQMLDDPDTMTVVSTIISLAHSLKLSVVAEGVETEEQAKVLRLLRCDEMQGYLFSKPLPLSGVTALLASR